MTADEMLELVAEAASRKGHAYLEARGRLQRALTSQPLPEPATLSTWQQRLVHEICSAEQAGSSLRDEVRRRMRGVFPGVEGSYLGGGGASSWRRGQAIVELGEAAICHVLELLVLERAWSASTELHALTNALLSWRTPSATEPLISLVSRHEDAATASHAIEVLGRLGDTEAAPVLIERLADPSERPAIRQAAAIALGLLAAPDAATLLHELAGDRELEASLRTECLEALGSVAPASACRLIGRLLADEHVVPLILRMIEVLEAAGGRQDAERLGTLASEHGNRLVRRDAERARAAILSRSTDRRPPSATG